MLRQFLDGHQRLKNSVHPAIRGVEPSYDRAVRLAVDNDGNCYGTAYLVAAILHAVQNPHHLWTFIHVVRNTTSHFKAQLLREQQVRLT